MSTEFIELAGKVNQQMPYHCVAKAQRALNDAGLPVKGARIAVLGVSYKPGVGDIRESPALKIIELLRGLGAGRQLPRPARPRAERARPAQRSARGGARRRRPGADRHRPSRASTTSWSPARARLRGRSARRHARVQSAPTTSSGCEPEARSARAGPAARRGCADRRGRHVRRARGVHDGTVDRRRLRDRGPRRARQAPAAGCGTRPRAARSALSCSARASPSAPARSCSRARSLGDGAILGDQSLRARARVGRRRAR